MDTERRSLLIDGRLMGTMTPTPNGWTFAPIASAPEVVRRAGEGATWPSAAALAEDVLRALSRRPGDSVHAGAFAPRERRIFRKLSADARAKRHANGAAA